MTHLHAIETNAIVYYRELARYLEGQVVEDDQITWFTTGRHSLPRFNGVLRTAARPEDLGSVAQPILDYFVSRHLPFFWVDWPGVGTPGLDRFLASSGLALVTITMPAMARSLSDVPHPSLPQGVELIQVQTERDQADWLNVFMAGFEEPEPARPDFGQFLARSLAGPQPRFEHFLARWQGAPCAIATLLRAGSVAGIYHVATLPAWRGRGLGRALTLAAMQSAQGAGDETAILFATPSGYPVYERLGFDTVSTAGLIAWTGDG